MCQILQLRNYFLRRGDEQLNALACDFSDTLSGLLTSRGHVQPCLGLWAVHIISHIFLRFAFAAHEHVCRTETERHFQNGLVTDSAFSTSVVFRLRALDHPQLHYEQHKALVGCRIPCGNELCVSARSDRGAAQAHEQHSLPHSNCMSGSPSNSPNDFPFVLSLMPHSLPGRM